MTLLGNLTTAIISATCGAALTAFVGFSFGGWMSRDASAGLAEKQVGHAIVEALLPYCVLRSKGSDASGIIAELRFGYVRNRAGVIANAGWATPLGSTRPNGALAEACSQAISADW